LLLLSLAAKALVLYPMMTPLKAPSSFTFNATFSCVFSAGKSVLVPSSVKETAPVQPELQVQESELPANQAPQEKAKRKRKLNTLLCHWLRPN
jgi:hypothetical protein